MKIFQQLPPIVFLIIATSLEASGDAIVRIALYRQVGAIRLALFLIGALALLGYGVFVNLPALEFGQVVGLYVATLFVMWQIINFLAFRALPTLPILTGGLLIIIG